MIFIIISHHIQKR
ncbi:unnamed protein product [Euphydryas editha]|uniref:Uncharacterized protein n=1 Tax=Euphydryas editha TaxID=104508 RepID=A0AAU9UBW6_EUPED|nr:unnamed protein product [Euphydryas editha]